MFQVKWSLFLVLVLSSFLVSCESEDDDESSSSNGSVIPGVVDVAGGFNVKINLTPGLNHYIHRDGNFTQSCTVAANETNFANQDISCTVEIEEHSGAFHGVKMVLNAPPGLCKYVWHRPYFYFGKEHGQGPTAATVRFNTEGGYVSGSVTGPGYIVGATGDVQCDYDYSATENGPNCCYGNYVKTTVTNFGSADPDKPQTTTTQTVAWTGKPGNCATGAGMNMAPLDTTYGLPMGQYFFAATGYNEEFDTKKRSKIDINSSLYYTNYYSGPAPDAFQITHPTPYFRGNPYYEWMCLDDAAEIISRIRVRIREWNSTAEFLLGSSGDSDATGAEINWGDSINDYPDWLDVGNNFPGMVEQ